MAFDGRHLKNCPLLSTGFYRKLCQFLHCCRPQIKYMKRQTTATI
jgi:hypothetical protein